MSKSLLIGLALIFSFGIISAQDRSITGKVTSAEDGTAIPGVNVVVKGTTTGAVTDLDGNYKLTSPSDGAILVFSFIGMETVEMEIGGRSVIDVAMGLDSEQLSEVVVVGYGTSTKEELTGSISIIDNEALEMMPKASFQDALQGAAPGLQVVSNDGAPGASIAVRVRGIGSINASNEPLYVIDGIPVTSGSISSTDFSNGGRSSNVMSSLNPNDIESLIVLKDAASTAIYGSRGANGVVLITTKSGKAGTKAKIDVKARWGSSDFAYNNLLTGLNRDQYEQLYLEGYLNAGTLTEQEARDQFASQFPINPETGDYYNTNWIEEMTRPGFVQEYDGSVTGGTDKLSYFVSGNYFDQDGVVDQNYFTRLSGRANLNARVNDRLIISNNLSISTYEQRGITDGTAWEAPFYLGILMAPTVPIYDLEGNYYAGHKGFFMGGNNPVGQLYDNIRTLRQTRFTDNLSASIEIVEGLTFKSAWSFDFITIREKVFENGRYGDGRNVGGTSDVAQNNVYNWLGTQTLNYAKTFNGAHNIDVLLGYEAQKVNQDGLNAYGRGFAHPELTNLRNAADPNFMDSYETAYAFNSYFARVNYDYQNKYYLSGSIRRDGSSRFGPDKRWGTFWSLGAGYTISEESFLQGVDFINLLKIRASYGITGNAGIGNFDWAGLWGFTPVYDGNGGAAPSQVANPNLTWESQGNTNIGLDLEMFNSRFRTNVDYFIRNSTELLLDRPLSMTTGFRTVQQNFGDMQNSGFEIALSGDVVSTDDFLLTLGANITFLKNELTKLPEAYIDGTKRREEGRDYQEYFLYGWAGVDPANGDPLWYTDSSRSETTNNVNEADRFYDGKSATPSAFGGFNLSANWKGLTLSAMFNYQFGNYVYDAPGWVLHGDGRFTPRSTSQYAFENRWTQEKADAGQTDFLFPQHRWGGNQSSNQRNSDRYLYDGDFIRLKRVNLSYNFPESITSRISMRSLQVYVSLDNYWTWTKDSELPFDPEQAISGVYNTTTPISKTVNFGINIGL